MLRKLSLLIAILVCLAALGVFAWVTDAPAYLGHAPATCNNCHVMDAQYENWYHAAHDGAVRKNLTTKVTTPKEHGAGGTRRKEQAGFLPRKGR